MLLYFKEKDVYLFTFDFVFNFNSLAILYLEIFLRCSIELRLIGYLNNLQISFFLKCLFELCIDKYLTKKLQTSWQFLCTRFHPNNPHFFLCINWATSCALCCWVLLDYQHIYTQGSPRLYQGKQGSLEKSAHFDVARFSKVQCSETQQQSPKFAFDKVS